MSAFCHVMRRGLHGHHHAIPVRHIYGSMQSFATKAEAASDAPLWAKSALDRKILSAESAESLFELIRHDELSASQAANAVNTLRKLNAEGKLEPKKVLEDLQFEKVCKVLDQNLHHIGHGTLLFTLRSLFALGVTEHASVVVAMENDLLWKVRKMSFKNLVILWSFHVNLQETDLQKKVVNEVRQRIQQRWFEISSPREIGMLMRHSKHFSEEFSEKLEDRTLELLDKLDADDAHKLICILAENKRRPTHLLRALMFQLSKHQQTLRPKQIANVLHAMHSLNFPDEVLLRRLSTDLLPEMTRIDRSSTFGSLVTAFGHLRWRNTNLLEASAEWLEKNIDSSRIQDVVSFVLTMAKLNYKTTHWESLFKVLSTRLDQSSISLPHVWLDVVWSLSVLRQASVDHIGSVLGEDFRHKLLGQSRCQSSPQTLKLLNLNAVALLEVPDYKGPHLSSDLGLNCTSIPLCKDEQALQASVLDSLNNFIPRGKFMALSRLAPSGITVDAEFVVDKHGKPLPLEMYSTDFGRIRSPRELPLDAHRIALLILYFKDFNLFSSEQTGLVSLSERLLQKVGYTVVKVSYAEFNPQATTLKRVQHLQNLILLHLQRQPLQNSIR